MLSPRIKQVSYPLLALVAPSLLAEATPSKPLDLREILQAAAKIDQLLEADLKAKKLQPLPIVSEGTFVRRTYLNIVGRIPTAMEASRFLDDKTPDKRTRLIEQLISSPGYDSSAFNYFADLLRLQTNEEQYGLGWHVWLRNSLASDKPWNNIVHEMLSAEGHTSKNPAVGYYLRDRGMLLDNVSNTVQVFLGHQIGCAQCHDHPFDSWTQMEYYEMAAFSGGITYRSDEARQLVNKVADHSRKNHPGMNRAFKSKNKATRAKARGSLLRRITGEMRYLLRYFNRNEIVESRSQELKLPDDYQYKDGEPGEVIQPATLFGLQASEVNPEDRRKVFADWVTSDENPYFAKVIANRLWRRTFGHGLVDPVDDWSDKLKGSHPEVLNYIEKVMKGVGYRTRDFERILYHTKLFQRQVSPVEATPGTDYDFIGPQLRRMSAEELYDSFTVLAFGNTDDKVNTGLEYKWKNYQSDVDALLNLSASKLIESSQEAQEMDDQRRIYQRKNREIQIAITKAKAAGNIQEERRLKRQQTQLRANGRKKQESMTGMSAVTNRSSRAGRAAVNMRASEHPSPFSAGSMVRQFGGSDRNSPEAAHTDATIPQALTLLNGQAAAGTENRRSKTFEALAEITNPEQRLEYLFLAFYSCRPSAAEKKDLLPLAEDREDIFTLARAMLTSKRYLFVQ
ncbi:MAG TPA: hypothetical protein DCQ96_10280 [Verrucomicrobiales bacterium]|nr:hypothetical protein [Verrucomicrobiales bacterium]|tara:strand:- start:481 stop:2523 length:2043 start_codon:yes stop_codon:yes gene_type:complete